MTRQTALPSKGAIASFLIIPARRYSFVSLEDLRFRPLSSVPAGSM
jgi:hypothetical protein